METAKAATLICRRIVDLRSGNIHRHLFRWDARTLAGDALLGRSKTSDAELEIIKNVNVYAGAQLL
jgi:hypothetical protein